MSFVRYYLPHTVSDYAMFYIGQARCYLQSYVNNTFSANEITSRIFVGDLASATNHEAMKEQGITHILSVFNGAYELFPSDFKYKIIHINDDEWIDISEYFEESNKFIDDAINSNPNNKVMIHCQRGVSRSVTLLMAYMIWKYNLENKIKEDDIDNFIKEILKTVKNHRSIAEPNIGFISFLKKYICKLNGYDKSKKTKKEKKDNVKSNNISELP